MEIDNKKVAHLVVDTSAFIQCTQLQNLAENVYTIQEVVDEIRNKRQLNRLVVLPYELKVKYVENENIVAVSEFSKKTGDYTSLSATDIKVMALTLQMTKELVGTNHIREAPVYQTKVKIYAKPGVEKCDRNERICSKEEEKSGIDVDSNITKQLNAMNEDNVLMDEDKELNVKFSCIAIDHQESILEQRDITNDQGNMESNKDLADEGWISIPKKSRKPKKQAGKPTQPNDNKETSKSSKAVNENDDDDDGWAGPAKYYEMKRKFNQTTPEQQIKVACITTDFAMQNVLKQMNLNVAALDGRIIKRLRTFIFRCYACFKTTSKMTERFCPNCGYQTLKKVSVSVNSEGRQRIYINGSKPLSKRGKKFSLPTPRGGKHAVNPILSADQPVPDQKPTKMARTVMDVFDDVYIAANSPFAVRDVNSKSALLGIRPNQQMKYWMQKNPNEAKRKKK